MKFEFDEKQNKLMVQYPVLKDIFRGPFDLGSVFPTKVVIDVQRIDENLLFFRGEYLNNIPSKIPDIKGDYYLFKKQFIFVVGQNNEIVAQHIWADHDPSRKLNPRIKDILFALVSVQTFQLQPESITSIIKVTRKVWRRTEANYAGEPWDWVKQEIYVTIYLPPKEPITELLERADVLNIQLSEKDVAPTVLAQDDTFSGAKNRIDELIRKFVFGVYCKGLKKAAEGLGNIHFGDPDPLEDVWKSTFGYASSLYGEFEGTEIFCEEAIQGKVIITITRGEKQITLIGDKYQDDPRMGLHSINSTAKEAEEMIDTIIRGWGSSFRWFGTYTGARKMLSKY